MEGADEGFFTLLPNETKMHIFSFLNYRDLATLSVVCKQWRGARLQIDDKHLTSTLAEDDVPTSGFMDILWRNLYYEDFMETSFNNSGVIARLGGPSAVKVEASSIWTGTPESFLDTEELFCWTQNQPFSW
jgi:hypothetical protein